MKCPQLLMFRPIEKSMEANYFGDCLKEECAWGDTGPEWCVLRSLAQSLVIIGQELVEIKDKMPHELQFRK